MLKCKVLMQLVEDKDENESSNGSTKTLSSDEATEMCCQTLDQLESIVFGRRSNTTLSTEAGKGSSVYSECYGTSIK